MDKEIEIKKDLKNTEVNLSELNTTFSLSYKTGRLMFKFDDDEPQEITTISNYGKVSLELKQQKKLDNKLQQMNTEIKFTSKDGKVFSLFIENL